MNGTVSRQPPVTRREILSWAFFDFANSSFTTVVITAVYSRFFITHIVPADSAVKDSYWSAAMILATVLGMIFSPFLGVISDAGALKKKILVGASLICATFTGLLWMAGPGDIWLAISLVVVASLGFMFSENFCASFLPDIATPETMGRISGLGWAIGYFGGLASLILVLKIIVTADPATQSDLYVSQNQVAMIATGLFFVVAALPTFLFVRNRQTPQRLPNGQRLTLSAAWGIGFDAFRNSLRKARQHPTLFKFLIAFMVYMAGLDAVIKFVGIYASTELSFDTGDITLMFLLIQLSAAAGALGFGFLEHRVGAKRTVEASLLLWITAILLIFFLPQLAELTDTEPKKLFFVISLLAGSGIGATQSSSRTIVGLLSGQEEAGEMFGYWGFFMKVATILGMMFGFLSDALDSRRMALLLILGFFVFGFLLVARLRLERPQRAQQEA